jgi:23S rRNA pseudouridine2605 synthase
VEREAHTAEGAWLRVIMHEGRKHEIRDIAKALGLWVHKLIRVRLGNLKIGSLKPGQWRVLEAAEVRELTKPQAQGSRPKAQGSRSRGQGAGPKAQGSRPAASARGAGPGGGKPKADSRRPNSEFKPWKPEGNKRKPSGH